MRSSVVVVMALGLLLSTIFAPSAAAQHFAEVRLANTGYRYADHSYTFKNSVVADVFYVGVPGSNEFNFGLGYAIKPRNGLTLTPLVYAVLTKEDNQRSIKLAMLLSFERQGWKVNSFLAYNIPLSRRAVSYQVVDTLDVTRVFKRWEIGLSSGFFHQDGRWNPQVGPVVKYNDTKGAWAVSYRFGPQRELRVGRTFVF